MSTYHELMLMGFVRLLEPHRCQNLSATCFATCYLLYPGLESRSIKKLVLISLCLARARRLQRQPSVSRYPASLPRARGVSPMGYSEAVPASHIADRFEKSGPITSR